MWLLQHIPTAGPTSRPTHVHHADAGSAGSPIPSGDSESPTTSPTHHPTSTSVFNSFDQQGPAETSSGTASAGAIAGSCVGAVVGLLCLVACCMTGKLAVLPGAKPPAELPTVLGHSRSDTTLPVQPIGDGVAIPATEASLRSTYTKIGSAPQSVSVRPPSALDTRPPSPPDIRPPSPTAGMATHTRPPTPTAGMATGVVAGGMATGVVVGGRAAGGGVTGGGAGTTPRRVGNATSPRRQLPPMTHPALPWDHARVPQGKSKRPGHL